MPSTLRELNFLAEALLLDPINKSKMNIVSVKGAEEGLDHLEIVLIDKHNKDSMWKHKVYTEEIPFTNHQEENVKK